MAWRDDGSGNLTVSGAKVSFTGSGNSKGNAIWSQGGTGSWEFKVTGSSEPGWESLLRISLQLVGG